jgi:DNA-binding transcriptional ArsR family regulator
MDKLWIDGPDGIADAPALKRHGPNEHLIGCPIWWLQHVLPVVSNKNQLVVAIYLWRRWVVCGYRKTFDVPNSELKSLGISRQTKYQTLTRLEAAGLIRIRRKGQGAPTLTILAKELRRKRQ